MAKEEAGSSRYGGDGSSRKSETPFASAWMSHWASTASCGSSVKGPKVSRRYESKEVGVLRSEESFRGNNVSSKLGFVSSRGKLEEEDRKERIGKGSTVFVDSRENLKLRLGPSGIGNMDSSLAKQTDRVAAKHQFAESPSNVTHLDLSTGAPRSSFFGKRKGMNEDENQLKRRHGKEDKGKMHNHSGLNLFPKDTDSIDGNGFEGFSGWSNAAQKMQSTSPLEERNRIPTSRSPPPYSKTYLKVKSTRITDVNHPESQKTLKDRSITSEFHGKGAREFLALSYDFPSEEGNSMHAKPNCSSKCNTNEAFATVKDSGTDSRNESSAETEAMDLDVLLPSNPSDNARSSLNKDINDESRLPISLFLATPFRNFVQKRVESTEMNEVDQEVSTIPVTTEPIEDEASTSRTESLDTENRISRFEKGTYQNSDLGIDRNAKLDYHNRWFKRLKPSYSLAFAYGTKCSVMDEDSYPSTTPKLFNKILRCSRSSSEPIISKSAMNGTALKLPSINEMVEREDSHQWIRRWCNKTNPYKEKKHEASVLGDMTKFPSVAAMALMRNAIHGFHHRSLRKKGAVVVWNADGMDRSRSVPRT